MSDTPRTDGIISGWIFGNATARLVDMSRTLERELANAIAERDSETRWADQYAAESYRLEMICQNAHDRLLRGDTEKELLAILEDAWKGRGVSVEERRARTSNPTGQGRADCGAYPAPGCSTPNG
jgi:hypothetical protein